MKSRILTKYVSLYFTLLCCNLSFSQNKIEVGNYLVDTENKTVSVSTFYSETNGLKHSWGVRFVEEPNIDFKNTTLYILWNQVFFKEFANKFIFSNLDSLVNIDTRFGSSGYVISKDNNFLYKSSINHGDYYQWVKLDISDYKSINDYIYQKGDTLYYLSADFKLEEIKGPKKFDLPSLKYIAGNYFYDKNKLFYFGPSFTRELTKQQTNNGKTFWNQSSKDSIQNEYVVLQKNNGKSIKPIIHDGYFLFGEKLYSVNPKKVPYAIPLDTKNLKLLEFNIDSKQNIKFLSDSLQTYVSYNNGEFLPFDITSTKLNNKLVTCDQVFETNLFEWEFVSSFAFVDQKNNAYLQGDSKTGREYAGFLIKIHDRFYTLNPYDSKLKQVNKVLVFNADEQEYEAIDFSKFRLFFQFLWTYKNTLYASNAELASKEYVNTANLDFVKFKDQFTNFLTDGFKLIFIGNTHKTSYIPDNGKNMHHFGKNIFSEVDLSSLKVINVNTLVDKNNLYFGNDNGINVVPLKEIGVNIRIFTDKNTIDVLNNLK